MSSELNKSEEDFEEYDETDEEAEEEESEEVAEDPNEETIRFELSQTPFEELLKLRDKLGTKVYNETIVSKIDANYGNSSRRKGNQNFKRLNKNRPQELSSKRPNQQLREVFQMKKSRDADQKRDPRFEPECGQYNPNIFNKTYSFLNDIRDKELNELTKMLKKSKNDEKRQELKYLLQRMKNQKIAEQMKQKKKDIETKARTQLNEVIEDKNKSKPFVNKSTLKRLELVDKFKELKKSGKLSKYMEKKRKRNAMRERKKMPANKANK